MKVGDLVKPKIEYEKENEKPRAIVLEMKSGVGHVGYATVKFFHLPLPATIFVKNYEVISESR